MSRKQQLVRELASVVVNNWIVTGDQPEHTREQHELAMRKSYRVFRIDELESLLAGITRM